MAAPIRSSSLPMRRLPLDHRGSSNLPASARDAGSNTLRTRGHRAPQHPFKVLGALATSSNSLTRVGISLVHHKRMPQRAERRLGAWGFDALDRLRDGLRGVDPPLCFSHLSPDGGECPSGCTVDIHREARPPSTERLAPSSKPVPAFYWPPGPSAQPLVTC